MASSLLDSTADKLISKDGEWLLLPHLPVAEAKAGESAEYNKLTHAH